MLKKVGVFTTNHNNNEQNNINQIDERKLEQEILHLQKKLSQLTFKFQTKILETEQEAHDRLVAFKAKQDSAIELRFQHLNNSWEKKLCKEIRKHDENLKQMKRDHENEMVKLNVQCNIQKEEIKQQEQIKYKNLLKLYNQQKIVIDTLKDNQEKLFTVTSPESSDCSDCSAVTSPESPDCSETDTSIVHMGTESTDSMDSYESSFVTYSLLKHIKK
jgi:hypothetical protein